MQPQRECLKLKAIFSHIDIPLTEIPTGKLKVMLIDEARERSESIAAILQSVDCEVVANVNPKHDLLEQVERYQPDIVIIDIDLPDRDMLENLRSVQSNTPQTDGDVQPG